MTEANLEIVRKDDGFYVNFASERVGTSAGPFATIEEANTAYDDALKAALDAGAKVSTEGAH
jgi:hypothetical protein